jgi:ubiquinone/menaquinone biosynthesis C-methylase UbiE
VPYHLEMADRVDANREVFDRVADSYRDLALRPAERITLGRLSDRLHGLSMLEIGVGSGRAAYTFAAIAHSYVGIDYAPRMVELARQLLGEDENTRLFVADARDLPFGDNSFDFVLFSFNGIDAVGNEDRLTILSEVSRVLCPGGHFHFSTHVLGALPLATRRYRPSRPATSRRSRALSRLTDIGYGPRIRKLNHSLDLDSAHERGWIVVPKIGHNFQVDDYYVDPALQVEQLGRSNLELVTIYDPEGREVELPYQGRGPWLDFLCRRVEAARRALPGTTVAALAFLLALATSAATLIPKGLG